MGSYTVAADALVHQFTSTHSADLLFIVLFFVNIINE